MPPEPTATVVGAAGAGVGAFFMAAIGIEPQPIFWALIGATFGLSFAAQTGRWRSIAVFACVVLTAAMVGSLLAESYFASSKGWRNAASWTVAAFFHPLFSAVVAAVPGVVQAGLRRIGLGGQP